MGHDIKGGGMSIYDTNTLANPSVQYGEGLIKPEPAGHMELENMVNTGTMGKIKSYDRVTNFILIKIGIHLPYKIQRYTIYDLSHALRRVQKISC